MAETIPNKLFSYDVNGIKYYDVLPDYNVSRSLTPVADPKELTDYIAYLKAQPAYVAGQRGSWDAQGLATQMEAVLSKYQSQPSSGNVASWTAPWGEVLQNVPQSQIDAITKNHGTPGYLTPEQFKAQNAAMAAQPQQPTGYVGNNVPGTTPQATTGATAGVSGTSGQYDHPAIKTRDLIIAGQPITIMTSSGGISYQIKSGDTLSGIAQRYGTTIDAILRANGLDPAGATKTILPVTQNPITDSSNVRPNESADAAKKAAEEAKVLADRQVEIQRLTDEKTIQDLKTSLGIDTGKPAKPTFESDYEALISAKGLTAVETQLNAVKDTRRTLEDEMNLKIKAESSRIGSKESVSIRQQKIKDSYTEQFYELDRREARLTDEYNTKANAVNTIMKLREMDYNAATNEYNTNFSQAMQLQTLLNSQQSEDKKLASANLSTVLTSLQKNNKTWDSMDLSAKTLITKLSMQSGIDLEVVKYALQTPSAKDIQYNFQTMTDASGKEFTQIIGLDKATGKVTTQNVYSGGISTSDRFGEKENIYLTRENFSNMFSKDSLIQTYRDDHYSDEEWDQTTIDKARSSGFAAFWSGNQKEAENYVNSDKFFQDQVDSIWTTIEEWRKAGKTDAEILKAMQSS